MSAFWSDIAVRLDVRSGALQTHTESSSLEGLPRRKEGNPAGHGEWWLSRRAQGFPRIQGQKGEAAIMDAVKLGQSKKQRMCWNGVDEQRLELIFLFT